MASISPVTRIVSPTTAWAGTLIVARSVRLIEDAGEGAAAVLFPTALSDGAAPTLEGPELEDTSTPLTARTAPNAAAPIAGILHGRRLSRNSLPALRSGFRMNSGLRGRMDGLSSSCAPVPASGLAITMVPVVLVSARTVFVPPRSPMGGKDVCVSDAQ